MAADRLWKIVNKMEETLYRSQSLSKDTLVHTLKEDLRQLKSGMTDLLRQSKSTEDMCTILGEDVLSRWKVCDCDKDNCPTCQAERAANIPPDKWETCAYPVSLPTEHNSATNTKTRLKVQCEVNGTAEPLNQRIQASPPKSNQSNARKEDLAERIMLPQSSERLPEMKELMSPVKHEPSSSQYSEYIKANQIQEVRCLTDVGTSMTGGTSKLIYQLHHSLSACGLEDQPGHPNACAIITLLFADKMLKAPPKVMLMSSYYSSYLTDEVFEMVLSSIREGSEIYMANYGGERVPARLSPEDTILLTSHLDRTIQEKMALDIASNQILVSSIMSLELGQILLFFRMDNYKVLSVISREDGKSVYIFDSQRHMTIKQESGKEEEYGAVLYEVYKDYVAVVSAVQLFQTHAGPFSGRCMIAILR